MEGNVFSCHSVRTNKVKALAHNLINSSRQSQGLVQHVVWLSQLQCTPGSPAWEDEAFMAASRQWDCCKGHACREALLQNSQSCFWYTSCICLLGAAWSCYLYTYLRSQLQSARLQSGQ